MNVRTSKLVIKYMKGNSNNHCCGCLLRPSQSNLSQLAGDLANDPHSYRLLDLSLQPSPFHKIDRLIAF